MTSKLKILENMIRKEVRNQLNEQSARVTHGEEEIHQLNDESMQDFASKYAKKPVDIFFMTDGTAHVTKRGSNVIFHGRDSGKSLNLKNVKTVYMGLENVFHTPDFFRVLLKSVYTGKKPRIKPTNF